MIVTWCEVCREFRDGEGGCPECGASRRGYEAVMQGSDEDECEEEGSEAILRRAIALGVTQRAIAERAGMSVSAISRMLRTDRRVRPHVAIAAAELARQSHSEV